MARLLTAGAESQDATIEGGTLLGAVTYDGGTVRSGSVAWKCDSTAGNANAWTSFAVTQVLGRSYFVRAYFRFTSIPTTKAGILVSAGASTGYWVFINTNGTLQLNFGNATDIGSPSAALTTGVWYRIELQQNIGTGAVDSAELRLDGVTIASETGASRSEAINNAFQVGLRLPGANIVCHTDDVAINDDQGANQNSWPGDGKVVFLKPTADSAVGTGWTLGTGTAISSNAFNSVNNTAPFGVADLAAGSDPKQIRNATSNANSAVDITMETYSIVGVGAGATVNVVDPIVMTAAPVVTSAKQGTVGLVSNPAITPIALAAGGTSGAFWSGVAAGTYPTGWKLSHSTVTYNPAVTLGTAPVMRINQVTSSTRIAMVCAMFIYVDFTPAQPLPILVTAPRLPS